MTHWTEAAELLDERESARPSAVARYAPGVFAFAMSAALGVYLVCLRPVVFSPAPQMAEAPAAKPDAFGGLAPVVPSPSMAYAPAGNPFGQIVTRGFEAPAQFSLSETPAPLPPVAPSDLRAPGDIDFAPLPPRRPSELAHIPARPAEPTVARLDPRPAAPAAVGTPAPAANQGLFGNLFGTVPAGRSGERPQEPRMAYAAPPPAPASAALGAVATGRGGAPGQGGFGGFLRGLTFNDGGSSSRFGDRVAVYDISAHVVYLPDGTRLEAHSGLGQLRDDPNGVTERMRGATPPATYALSPREGSFHGVDALRLTPIDSGVYGRAGLLAHTYMLGAEGDSNGCVSFRDYEAFLRAYRSGQITKLVVVTRL